MRTPIGARVAAIHNMTETTVFLYGYGVYDGDYPFEIMPGLTLDNPRITLDNGQVVFGAQCWWGPEELTKQKFNGRPVEMVPVP